MPHDTTPTTSEHVRALMSLADFGIRHNLHAVGRLDLVIRRQALAAAFIKNDLKDQGSALDQLLIFYRSHEPLECGNHKISASLAMCHDFEALKQALPEFLSRYPQRPAKSGKTAQPKSSPSRR